MRLKVININIADCITLTSHFSTWMVGLLGGWKVYNAVTLHVSLLGAFKRGKKQDKTLLGFLLVLSQLGGNQDKWGYTEVTGLVTDRHWESKSSLGLSISYYVSHLKRPLSVDTEAALCFQVTILTGCHYFYVFWQIAFGLGSILVLKVSCENALFIILAAAFWCGLPGRGGRQDLC